MPMGTTENYNLYVEDDASTRFQNWRESMNGSSNSNMTKIDTALAEKADKPVAFSVTLSSSGWSNSAQTVSDNRFIANGYAYIVSADPASFSAYTKAMVYADDVTTDGQMTFRYGKAPSAALSVSIVRVATA